LHRQDGGHESCLADNQHLPRPSKWRAGSAKFPSQSSFSRTRHLLGFDTPTKALVTAVKEAVDNALDACEEAGILPDIKVQVGDRYGKSRVIVEDNGPGIVESQIARIFGKLLYGSKFHKLSQSRGQQGMGISAAGMYGQLTVGKPLHIVSRVKADALASEMFVSIDTARNQPDIHKKKQLRWDRPHGTLVEMEMEGHYQKGPHSIEAYLQQTAIANPHVSIAYAGPHRNQIRFVRSTKKLPTRPTEIKPHPYGIELGRLIQMLNNSASRTLLRFLIEEFSCVGRKTALKIIELARKQSDRKLSDRSYPRHIAHAQATALHRAIQKTRVSAPRTDCIVPIGEKQLLEGLRKEVSADFYTVTTRPAQVTAEIHFRSKSRLRMVAGTTLAFRSIKVAIRIRRSQDPAPLSASWSTATSLFISCVLPTACRFCISNPVVPSQRP
jgi:DNA topoisomerase-6 subunit B